MPVSVRKYDLVVLGATGYTGKLTAEHINEFLPDLVEKLKKLSPKRLPPSIEICVPMAENLNSLARKTRVIITLLGPYAKFGTPVMEACVKNGTHYLDTTGEIYWVGQMVRRFHEDAKAAGVILLSQIGAESGPYDLITFSAVSKLRTEASLKTKELIVSINESKLALSGGTLASFFNMYESIDQKTMTASLQPWALSPISGRKAPNAANTFGLRRDKTLGLLSASSPTERQDRALVHRSWALLDAGNLYGKNFFYNEYQKAGGVVGGVVAKIGTKLVGASLSSAILRNLIGKFSPAPGEGLDPKEEKNFNIEIFAVAVADEVGPSETRALSKLRYAGGTYHITAALLAQGAATILYESGLVERVGGGLLTPAVIGQPYIERLRGVGLSIDTVLL
ncbi:putative trans-acting enoyl reductase [Lachnellula suecica]|uniref:Putative trans-acting enoyl reductase n=1 Tax=Lachnellula suecica TaxID=602035 RepID=A0A8T9C8H8_9HELO|nr:putative trans-acting enoyl reductase [Lachnellula suecica]